MHKCYRIPFHGMVNFAERLTHAIAHAPFLIRFDYFSLAVLDLELMVSNYQIDIVFVAVAGSWLWETIIIIENAIFVFGLNSLNSLTW